MASYQNEFKSEPTALKKLVDAFDTSSFKKKIKSEQEYYDGNNTAINEFQRYYWSDKEGRWKLNTYVSNNQIAYGIFHDIVSQKVNTILNEKPMIDSEFAFTEEYLTQLGYALKQAGNKASINGKAFIYEDYDGQFTVFDNESTIPFYDDVTNKLMALIRYWDVFLTYETGCVRYIEVYEPDGMTRYKSVNSGPYEIDVDKTAYKFVHKTSALTDEIENVNLPILPIIEFKNNENRKSDLRSSLRCKIDSIDFVNSGFANNIDDFSEVYWVIKNAGGMDNDEFEDFTAAINRTRKLIVESNGDGSGFDADPKQIAIPTEARTKYVEDRKAEIREETGVIDTASLAATQLTNVAIEAATMKLKQRASEFEWHAYNAVRDAIEILKLYNSIDFDYEIDFTWLLIKNQTEMIQNANSVQANISRESYLKLLQEAGIVDDVDNELERIKAQDEESMSKYSLVDEEGEEK